MEHPKNTSSTPLALFKQQKQTLMVQIEKIKTLCEHNFHCTNEEIDHEEVQNLMFYNSILANLLDAANSARGIRKYRVNVTASSKPKP